MKPCDTFSWFAFSHATSSVRVLAGSDAARQHQQRACDQERDRLEIRHHVVAQRIDGAVEHLRADVADADGVAVRRRARDAADADRPPAPLTFSITNGCPSVPRMCSAITRATWSSGPPAGYGTISEIGRDG